MNLRDAVSLIGREVHVRTSDGLLAPVTVEDVRSAYGKVRFVVIQDQGTSVLRSEMRVTVDGDRVKVKS